MSARLAPENLAATSASKGRLFSSDSRQGRLSCSNKSSISPWVEISKGAQGRSKEYEGEILVADLDSATFA